MLDRVRQEIIEQITNIGIDAKSFHAKINKKNTVKQIDGKLNRCNTHRKIKLIIITNYV